MRRQPPDVRCHGRQHLVDIGRVKRWARVEAHRVAVPREDAVENQRVNANGIRLTLLRVRPFRRAEGWTALPLATES